MLNTEQFTATNNANLEVLVGITTKAFEGVEKLTALNLQVVKTSLGEAAETSRAALAVKDQQSLPALQADLLQPAAEKAAAYGRHVYDIVAATYAEIGEIVAGSVAQAQKAFATSFDETVKNAPAGTENAVAFVKSAVSAANNAYETVQKAVKQAADAVEANVEAVTATTTEAAGSLAKRAA